MTRTAEEIRIGDVVRHEDMATDAGGEELKDCEVVKSYGSQLGSWVIEWRMVGDDAVTGTLLINPNAALEVVSKASGGGL
jgi:hypothetical protein